MRIVKGGGGGCGEILSAREGPYCPRPLPLSHGLEIIPHGQWIFRMRVEWQHLVPHQQALTLVYQPALTTAHITGHCAPAEGDYERDEGRRGRVQGRGR